MAGKQEFAPDKNFTIENARVLCDELRGLAAEADEISFNFNKIDKIDLAGIQILLSCLLQAREKDTKVSLAALPSAAINTVLKDFGFFGTVPKNREEFIGEVNKYINELIGV